MPHPQVWKGHWEPAPGSECSSDPLTQSLFLVPSLNSAVSSPSQQSRDVLSPFPHQSMRGAAAQLTQSSLLKALVALSQGLSSPEAWLSLTD